MMALFIPDPLHQRAKASMYIAGAVTLWTQPRDTVVATPNTWGREGTRAPRLLPDATRHKRERRARARSNTSTPDTTETKTMQRLAFWRLSCAFAGVLGAEPHPTTASLSSFERQEAARNACMAIHSSEQGYDGNADRDLGVLLR